MTDVLVITTTVGVLYRVHCHTSHLGPLVAFHTVFVIAPASLEHGFVRTATAGDNTDLSTAPDHKRRTHMSEL